MGYIRHYIKKQTKFQDKKINKNCKKVYKKFMVIKYKKASATTEAFIEIINEDC